MDRKIEDKDQIKSKERLKDSKLAEEIKKSPKNYFFLKPFSSILQYSYTSVNFYEKRFCTF